MLAALGAIAEPTRFDIVEFLRDGPRSVGEIVQGLHLRQPQVSKHLRVLNDAGVVVRHPDGQVRIYSLNARAFEELDAWLGTYRSIWTGRVDALEEYLQHLRAKRESRKRPRSSPS